jgi:hypothetical protein
MDTHRGVDFINSTSTLILAAAQFITSMPCCLKDALW